MGLYVLAYVGLFSADIGQSQKILLRFIYFECGYLEERSILTAWEPLAIHLQVRANRVLIGLGCSSKIRTTEIVLFCELETNNSIFYTTEIF